MSPRVDPAERRAEILNATIRCFMRTGYHRTAVDDVVAESGLSKGTIYWHFDNKETLFLEAFKFMMDGLIGQLSDLPLAGSAADQIRQVMDATAGMLAARDDLTALPVNFLMELWQVEGFTAYYRAALAPFAAQIAGLIDAGIASGEFRPVDADDVAWSFMVLIDGFILYHMLQITPDTLRQMAAITDVTLAGLRASAPA
jgi:AcrR family transcriptional regulator